LDDLIFSALAGIAFVEAAARLIESARGQGPSNWYVGRSTWALMGISTFLGSTWYGICGILRRRVSEGAFPSVDWCLRGLIDRPWVFLEQLAWVPLGLYVAARLGRWPRDPKPDGRVWAGRAFGMVLVLSRIVVDLYFLDYWSR
jgi:hypothetical protein